MTTEIDKLARLSARTKRLRLKTEKALEAAPGPWHHFVNRHNTRGGMSGERQGAMELKAHPALGAGTALYKWQGEKGYAISDFIASTDPATTLELLDHFAALLEVAEAARAFDNFDPEDADLHTEEGVRRYAKEYGQRRSALAAALARLSEEVSDADSDV